MLYISDNGFLLAIISICELSNKLHCWITQLWLSGVCFNFIIYILLISKNIFFWGSKLLNTVITYYPPLNIWLWFSKWNPLLSFWIETPESKTLAPQNLLFHNGGGRGDVRFNSAKWKTLCLKSLNKRSRSF